MPTDYYSDTDDSDSAGVDVENSEESKTDKGAATALLPKDFFGDKELKPGTRCEIEVTRVLEDQIEAKKVPQSEYRKGEGKHKMPDGSMMEDSEMEEMMA